MEFRKKRIRPSQKVNIRLSTRLNVRKLHVLITGEQINQITKMLDLPSPHKKKKVNTYLNNILF